VSGIIAVVPACRLSSTSPLGTAGFLALAVAGPTSQDVQIVRAAYLAEPIAEVKKRLRSRKKLPPISQG
jgi:hypothetical protein